MRDDPTQGFGVGDLVGKSYVVQKRTKPVSKK